MGYKEDFKSLKQELQEGLIKLDNDFKAFRETQQKELEQTANNFKELERQLHLDYESGLENLINKADGED